MFLKKIDMDYFEFEAVSVVLVVVVESFDFLLNNLLKNFPIDTRFFQT
jgi:hypothetical protein